MRNGQNKHHRIRSPPTDCLMFPTFHQPFRPEPSVSPDPPQPAHDPYKFDDHSKHMWLSFGSSNLSLVPMVVLIPGNGQHQIPFSSAHPLYLCAPPAPAMPGRKACRTFPVLSTTCCSNCNSLAAQPSFCSQTARRSSHGGFRRIVYKAGAQMLPVALQSGAQLGVSVIRWKCGVTNGCFKVVWKKCFKLALKK